MSGGTCDCEFDVGCDPHKVAEAFLGVALSSMAEETGESCWASLERFRTLDASGEPCDGDFWDWEADAKLVALRSSEETR